MAHILNNYATYNTVKLRVQMHLCCRKGKYARKNSIHVYFHYDPSKNQKDVRDVI